MTTDVQIGGPMLGGRAVPWGLYQMPHQVSNGYLLHFADHDDIRAFYYMISCTRANCNSKAAQRFRYIATVNNIIVLLIEVTAYYRTVLSLAVKCRAVSMHY